MHESGSFNNHRTILDLIVSSETHIKVGGLAVIYISYDGMLEPLGQSQVVAYLEQLARDWPVYLISFEKERDRKDDKRMAAMHARLQAVGIAWTPLAYHKAPSAAATAYDIAVGAATALSILIRHKVRIVHARSYVSAMIALGVKRASGAKFLFDMRGLWADERVDAGLWAKEGALYKAAKAMERRFLEAADHVVTLTHASAHEIARFPYLQGRMPPITVIPCCADLDRFRPTGPSASFTLGYVGAVGLGHMFEEALTFYGAVRLRRTDARFLIVNRSEHDTILAALDRAGIEPDRVDLVTSEHRDVPGFVQAMTAAVALYKPQYSAVARSPTKLAEYLGCGVPCVGNAQVGDMEEIIEGERVGVVLRDFSAAAHAAAADRLLALLDEPGTRQRCVATARRLFSLDVGVEAYRQIYDSLAGRDETAHGLRTVQLT